MIRVELTRTLGKFFMGGLNRAQEVNKKRRQARRNTSQNNQLLFHREVASPITNVVATTVTKTHTSSSSSSSSNLSALTILTDFRAAGARRMAKAGTRLKSTTPAGATLHPTQGTYIYVAHIVYATSMNMHFIEYLRDLVRFPAHRHSARAPRPN